MLHAGTLTRLIDVFDLFWHGAPLSVPGMKVSRMIGRKLEGG